MQTKIISSIIGKILKTTYLSKKSIPLVPRSINLFREPVFLFKWKSSESECRCLKTIIPISLVANWDIDEKKESLISLKAKDEILANPYAIINPITKTIAMLEFSLIKVKESIVLPKNIGVIKVATFAENNKVTQINNLILNLFVKLSQRKGFRKLKISIYL